MTLRAHSCAKRSLALRRKCARWFRRNGAHVFEIDPCERALYPRCNAVFFARRSRRPLTNNIGDLCNYDPREIHSGPVPVPKSYALLFWGVLESARSAQRSNGRSRPLRCFNGMIIAVMYDSPSHAAENRFDDVEELGTGGQWGGLYNRISFGQSFINSSVQCARRDPWKCAMRLHPTRGRWSSSCDIGSAADPGHLDHLLRVLLV